MIVNNSPETIVADLYAMIDRANSIPSLSQIACPTLIIVGELDRGTPPSDAQFMAKHITGARLAVLAEAAHLSNLENPEAFEYSDACLLERDRAGRQPALKVS